MNKNSSWETTVKPVVVLSVIALIVSLLLAMVLVFYQLLRLLLKKCYLSLIHQQLNILFVKQWKVVLKSF